MNQTYPQSNATETNYNITLPILGKLEEQLSESQIIGIIVAAFTLFLVILVLCTLGIYQRYRIKAQKVSLTSNNPCYVSGEDSRNLQAGGHCNLSATNDGNDDADDATSLDNDNFLNSLEHLQFVGYLNEARSVSSCSHSLRHSTIGSLGSSGGGSGGGGSGGMTDHSLSRLSSASTVHSNRPIYPSQRSVKATSTRQGHTNEGASHHHQHRSSTSSRPPSAGVQLRVRRPKRPVSTALTSAETHQHHNIQSETISESTGSTANLIGGSRIYLTESQDSVATNAVLAAGAAAVSEESVMPTSQEADGALETLPSVVDDPLQSTAAVSDKMDSSTDSRSSVNSTSAMMSNYSESRTSPTLTSSQSRVMPDVVNSNQPPSYPAAATAGPGANVKRAVSAYTNPATSSNGNTNIQDSSDFYPHNYPHQQPVGPTIILDPLTAGSQPPAAAAAATASSSSSTSNSRFHMRHFSHSNRLSPSNNAAMFEFNLSSTS